MLTRLDAILLVGCLTSGTMALENHHRVDVAALDDGPAVETASTIVCEIPPPSPLATLSEAALYTAGLNGPVTELPLVCRRAG